MYQDKYMPTTLIPQETRPPDTARPKSQPQAGLRRWTADEYQRMLEIDLFDGDRVELLRGQIWNAGRQSPPHTTFVHITAKTLKDAFGTGFLVSQKMPVALNDVSEPEPDIAVATGEIDDYAEHHPGTSEILLLAEVADDTLAKDRETKMAIYAEAGVSEYWIVNLIQRQLEVYRQPSPAGIYRDCTTYLLGQCVAPLSGLGKAIMVSELLPPLKAPHPNSGEPDEER